MRSHHADLVNGVEEWEFPLRRGDALREDRETRAGRSPDFRRGPCVPAGALAQLEEAIGEVLPFGALVLPQSTRPQGRGWRTRVCTPAQVVGLSVWGVALWVDLFGVRDWLPLGELAVIENQQAHGHGRLVLRGPRHRIAVRYPASAAQAVREFTAAVRSLVMGYPMPVPATRLHAPAVLRRWRPVLDGKGAADSDFAAVETRLPGWWHRRRARRVLVGVTPQELLVALAPGSGGATELPDVIYVPRGQLTGVMCGDRSLHIEAGGVLVDVTMGRRHAARVRHRLGLAIPGSGADTDETPRTTPDQPPIGP